MVDVNGGDAVAERAKDVPEARRVGAARDEARRSRRRAGSGRGADRRLDASCEGTHNAPFWRKPGSTRASRSRNLAVQRGRCAVPALRCGLASCGGRMRRRPATPEARRSRWSCRSPRARTTSSPDSGREVAGSGAVERKRELADEPRPSRARRRPGMSASPASDVSWSSRDWAVWPSLPARLLGDAGGVDDRAVVRRLRAAQFLACRRSGRRPSPRAATSRTAADRLA